MENKTSIGNVRKGLLGLVATVGLSGCATSTDTNLLGSMFEVLPIVAPNTSLKQAAGLNAAARGAYREADNQARVEAAQTGRTQVNVYNSSSREDSNQENVPTGDLEIYLTNQSYDLNSVINSPLTNGSYFHIQEELRRNKVNSFSQNEEIYGITLIPAGHEGSLIVYLRDLDNNISFPSTEVTKAIPSSWNMGYITIDADELIEKGGRNWEMVWHFGQRGRIKSVPFTVEE